MPVQLEICNFENRTWEPAMTFESGVRPATLLHHSLTNPFILAVGSNNKDTHGIIMQVFPTAVVRNSPDDPDAYAQYNIHDAIKTRIDANNPVSKPIRFKLNPFERKFIRFRFVEGFKTDY